jgi:hypothetical protein
MTKGASPKVHVLDLFKQTDSAKLRLFDFTAFKSSVAKMAKKVEINRDSLMR